MAESFVPVKIFFEGSQPLPNPELSGYQLEWSRFVDLIGKGSHSNEVTYDSSKADFIVTGSNEQVSLTCLLPQKKRSKVNEYVWDWGDRPTGRQAGLYAALNKRLFDSSSHRSFIYPIDFNERVSLFPTSACIYDFGFVGGLTASIRVRLLNHFIPQQASTNSIFKCQGTDWTKHFDRNDAPNQIKDDYVGFLKETKFILCPRGYGVGSIRLFETMKAGRVPIIISDDYVLPDGPQWEDFCIFVAENEIQKIPLVVKQNLPRWEEMAQLARQHWEQYYSPLTLLDQIATQLVNLQENRRVQPPTNLFRSQCRLWREVALEYARPLAGKVRKVLSRK